MRCLRNPPGWLVPAVAVGAVVAFFALRKKPANASTLTNTVYVPYAINTPGAAVQTTSAPTPMPRPVNPSAAAATGQRQVGASIFDPAGGAVFGMNLALATAAAAQQKAQERAAFNAQADVGRLMDEWRTAKDGAASLFAEYKKAVGDPTAGYRRDFLKKQFEAAIATKNARAATLKQFGVSVPE